MINTIVNFNKMQKIYDKVCDEGPKIYKTTHGEKINVRLELISDDGLISIKLCSRGNYRIKIGYRYTAISDNIICDKNENEKHNVILLKTYIISKHIIKYGPHHGISIPISWNKQDIEINEKNILDNIGDYNFYVLEIDIIELEKIVTN